MPEGWQWDESLYAGSAAYYARGRLPYPSALAPALREALGLDGSGRLIDVGCGPGIIAVRVAHLFAETVGVDADAGMLAEAARRAGELGVRNARWLRMMAEDLPGDLGTFRVATFGRSFHWMERQRVAAAVREMLKPGGAFVQVSMHREVEPAVPVPGGGPLPPREAIGELVARYLGEERRAGRGRLRHGTPSGENEVLISVGFGPAEIVELPSDGAIRRPLDDIVAEVFSKSSSAPHLFGARLPAFEGELRALLAEAAPAGVFEEPLPPAELRIWRK